MPGCAWTFGIDTLPERVRSPEAGGGFADLRRGCSGNQTAVDARVIIRKRSLNYRFLLRTVDGSAGVAANPRPCIDHEARCQIYGRLKTRDPVRQGTLLSNSLNELPDRNRP